MYVWLGLCSVDVLPSPKSQLHEVISPVEASVNAVVTGAVPLKGVPEKSAAGTAAATDTYAVLVSVSEPPGPVTVSDTV